MQKLICFQYFITLVVFFWIGLFMSAKWLFLEFQRFTNWLIYWDQKNISRRYVKRVFDRASYGLFYWNENFDQRKCRNFISSSDLEICWFTGTKIVMPERNYGRSYKVSFHMVFVSEMRISMTITFISTFQFFLKISSLVCDESFVK